jgi:hypothetical protein
MNVIEEHKHYYRNRDVRARIQEFIGRGETEKASCEFLAATDEDAPPPFKSAPKSLLPSTTSLA